MKKYQILSFLLIGIISFYPNLPKWIVDWITNPAQFYSWESEIWNNYNINKIKKSQYVFNPQELQALINGFKKENPSISDEAINQGLQELSDEKFLVVWDKISDIEQKNQAIKDKLWITKENILYKVPNIWWKIIWWLVSTLWVVLYYPSFLWRMMEWAQKIADENWKVGQWILEFIWWFIWIFICSLLILALFHVLKFSIAYIRTCMKVFPRVLPNTISRAKWKILSIVIVILYIVILFYTSRQGTGLRWFVYNISLFTNVVVIWVLIVTINDLSSKIKEKKWLEEIVIWFKT